MSSTESRAKTLVEKVWEKHVVRSAEGEPDLLYVDLHLVHEVTSPQAFEGLRLAGRKVRRPDLTYATMDHNVPTTEIGLPIRDGVSAKQMEALSENCEEFGIQLNEWGSIGQGIVHIIGPEMGLTQPGLVIVCGDSHTATHGAFGALAFGIGTSEVEHVLATQTLPQSRPKTMAVTVEGELPADVTAKDLMLGILNRIGTGGGVGHVIEYRGEAIRNLSMEGRMTVCNMSIEGGARAGLIAPDETTFEYLRDKPYAPKGENWDAAVEEWKSLRTDESAEFDREVVIPGCGPGAVRLVGDAPGPDRAARRCGARAGERRPRACLEVHGPHAGDSHPGDRGRHRLPGLLHQRAHRGPARSRRRAGGPPGKRRHPGDGGAGFDACKEAGRRRRVGRHIHGGGLRLAQRRMLDVSRDEPGHLATR